MGMINDINKNNETRLRNDISNIQKSLTRINLRIAAIPETTQVEEIKQEMTRYLDLLQNGKVIN